MKRNQLNRFEVLLIAFWVIIGIFLFLDWTLIYLVKSVLRTPMQVIFGVLSFVILPTLYQTTVLTSIYADEDKAKNKGAGV